MFPRDNKRRKERMETMRRGRKVEEEREQSRIDKVKRKEGEVKRDKGVDSHAFLSFLSSSYGKSEVAVKVRQ